MGALDDINLLLQKKDDNGFKPVAPWQEGFEEGEDVNGNPTTTEPMARAARKRAGLPVDDNPHDHTGTPAGEKAGTAAGTEEKPQYSIAELIKLSHPYNEERTKEEEEMQKKKQKRDAVFAAIGDGLNAFHQAYAYSRGIKPLTENKSQSKAVRDKYDALDKEREAHKAEYLNAYIRGLQADEERGNREREYKLKERQQTRLEEDVKIRAAKAEAYANYQSSVVAKNEAQAAYWQAKANALEAGLPLEEAIKKAEEARKLVQARASDAAAAKYGAVTKGGGGKPAGGGSGKKPLPGQSQPKTTKKQLP